jgi:hypothetical protein
MLLTMIGNEKIYWESLGSQLIGFIVCDSCLVYMKFATLLSLVVLNIGLGFSHVLGNAQN